MTKISTSTLSRHPQSISDTDWYYEAANNIILVHEVRDRKNKNYIRTDQIKIPWHMLFRSANRAKGVSQRERRIIKSITKHKNEKTNCD